MAARRTPKAPAPTGGRRAARKAKAGTAGLEPRDTLAFDEPAIAAVRARVEAAEGVVVGAYRDPFGGFPLVLAVVPIARVAPTPFQRDLSDAHHKRLAEVVQKTGRFLDPVIAVTAPTSDDAEAPAFWTPNGRHRLEAMRRLGARAITALVVPDREVAWQILALNTEKAHNLKERALEVVRIYRGLLEEDTSRPEASFAFYLEDPALVTLGVCYERAPRFAGGAYHPVLRRVETFVDAPIGVAIARHEALAALVLELEEAVVAAVEKLRARGLTSPYLRSFVVARINPLRWLKGEPPPAEDVVRTMRDRARRFDVSKVRQEDLARAGGAPDDEA